jgi:hypothetical protein
MSFLRPKRNAGIDPSTPVAEVPRLNPNIFRKVTFEQLTALNNEQVLAITDEQLGCLPQNVRNFANLRVKSAKDMVAAQEALLKAEEGRLKAEEGRLKAEEGRLKAEEGRLKAEQQSREDREGRQRAESQLSIVQAKLLELQRNFRRFATKRGLLDEDIAEFNSIIESVQQAEEDIIREQPDAHKVGDLIQNRPITTKPAKPLWGDPVLNKRSQSMGATRITSSTKVKRNLVKVRQE